MTTEDYLSFVAERSRRGMAETAESGRLPGCAPVGYRNETRGYKKLVVVDEGAAPLVRDAFRRAAVGYPLRGILAELAPQGLAGRNGKEMGASSLHKVLTNPFYAGMIRFKGRLIPGSHEPLVDGRTFEMAQRQLASASLTECLF